MQLFRSFVAKAQARKSRKAATSPRTRTRLGVEALENRSLPSCNSISGHVFHDLNNNGLMEAGEQPLANVSVQLRNSQNVVVATAVSDANGYYEFDEDATVNQAVTTLSKTVNFPATQTNYSLTGLAAQFDPSLGTLLSVEITNAGSITSNIRVENTSGSSASTINATVGGNLTLSGPGGLSIQTNMSSNAGTYGASIYDGVLDFNGTSGREFGNKTASGSQSTTLTGNDMTPFIGTGNVSLTEAAVATSTANGGGNLLVGVTSTATAQVTVVYRYIPSNCLKAGNYTIVKTSDPPGYYDGKESRDGFVIPNPPGTSVIPLTLGSTDLFNNDFGEVKPASLSGYVYADTSLGGFNDGIKQPGELGFANVTITLEGSDDNGTVNRTTTTDASGFYIFSNLRPGFYTITETQPVGWTDGKDTIGTPGGITSNDKFSNIKLISGFAGVNNNFGEVKLGQLSGVVFNDSGNGGIGSNNGMQEADDPGIAGVTVQLTGVDNFSNPVSLTTTTDVLGRYSFTNLLPGVYTITEVQPAGYSDGKDTLGTLGGVQANDQFSSITMPAGGAGVNYNFGELLPSTLAGYVYADLGVGSFNDGVKQVNEAGIAGVVITLTGSTDSGPVSMQLTTDANGYYKFTGLRPGIYTIAETQPAGWGDGKDSIGTPGGVTGFDQFSMINLPPGYNGVNNNFGEIKLGQLGGTVFSDSGLGGYNNGVQDPNEAGIAGVTIQLLGVDFANNTVSQLAITDALGRYSFTNLTPGTYSLSETQPAGYLDGKDSLGSLGGQQFNDQFSNIVVPPNGVGVNYNFGEVVPSSISGTVFSDTGSGGYNDGIQQFGEAGIANVLITLTGVSDQGAVNVQQTTDANGNYRFSNLRAGIYTITETQPAGWVNGKTTIGAINATVGTDVLSNINLPGGTNDPNNNFGELKFLPATISGTVYSDTSANGYNSGTQDFGEPGIAGVLITLTGNTDQGSVTLQQWTDTAGQYSFTGLRPGTYALTETQPSGWIDGKDSIGLLGGTTGNDIFSNINLPMGGGSPNNNFGELMPSGTISGKVFSDTNPTGYNNAIQDAGETGIAGVLISLTGTNDQGAVSLQQMTDAIGQYNFTGLRPGTYTLTETQPGGWIDGKDSIGLLGGITGNDVFSNINLPMGGNSPNNNFGELKPVILVSHDPILPKDIVPGPPQIITPSLSIISKGQLLASKLSVGDPGATSDARFINALYTSVLGRQAEEAGLNGWYNYLRNGGTRRGLTDAIWQSDEHRAREISNMYQSILGVTADQSAINTYLPMFRSGSSEFDVASAIAGSALAASLYPSQSDLVTKLYDYALGRNPSPQELGAWLSFGGSRTALAKAIVTSDEALSAVVQRSFIQLLGRTAGASEVAGRIAQLRGSASGYNAMITEIFTSSEFAARLA